jgi:hypothetical protein
MKPKEKKGRRQPPGQPIIIPFEDGEEIRFTDPGMCERFALSPGDTIGCMAHVLPPLSLS